MSDPTKVSESDEAALLSRLDSVTVRTLHGFQHWSLLTPDQIDQLFKDAAQGVRDLLAKHAEALKILDTQSGDDLLDACRQVKQAAISEADNSEMLEVKLRYVEEDRDDLQTKCTEAFDDAVRAEHERVEQIKRADAAEATLAACRELPRYKVSDVDDMLLPGPQPDGIWISWADLQRVLDGKANG